MRYLLMLAAAASFAACHNRSEDEVGAAPDRGDTTAVAADTTHAAPTDSTMGQTPAPTTDTTAAQPSDAGMSADTSMAAPTTDSTSVGGVNDSTNATPTPSDSTSSTPSDSTSSQ